jgi:primosomal protein N' (replication factor Y)
MIVKGHDFSNVTLVGVLAADSSMNVGDYKANEKTFQLLTQMAGRAGRGDKKGTAIIQTYMPDEFCIETAKEQDYTKFYNTEINLREKLNYPPFCDIIVFGVSGLEEENVKKSINELYDDLKENFNIYRPTPAPITKINGEYRWRILIKEKINDEKNKIIGKSIEKFLAQKHDVKLSVDINPNNMN